MHLNPVSQNSYSFQPEACWNLKPSFQGLISACIKVRARLPGCKQFTFGFTQLQPFFAVEASHISLHQPFQAVEASHIFRLSTMPYNAFFCSRDINDHKSMHGMQCTDPRLGSCLAQKQPTTLKENFHTKSPVSCCSYIYMYIYIHICILYSCSFSDLGAMQHCFQHHSTS